MLPHAGAFKGEFSESSIALVTQAMNSALAATRPGQCTMFFAIQGSQLFTEPLTTSVVNLNTLHEK